MTPSQWYSFAAGDFSPTALADTPAYSAPIAIRGYDVVFERAGVGLVINPWRSSTAVVVALKSLWQYAPGETVASFGMIRSLSIDEWDRSSDTWLDAAAGLARARTNGWFVLSSEPSHVADEAVGLSVVHPLTNREVVRIPRFARHYFDARAHAQLRQLVSQLDRLGALETSERPEARRMVEIVRARGVERHSTSPSPVPVRIDNVVGRRVRSASGSDEQ